VVHRGREVVHRGGAWLLASALAAQHGWAGRTTEIIKLRSKNEGKEQRRVVSRSLASASSMQLDWLCSGAGTSGVACSCLDITPKAALPIRHAAKSCAAFWLHTTRAGTPQVLVHHACWHATRAGTPSTAVQERAHLQQCCQLLCNALSGGERTVQEAMRSQLATLSFCLELHHPLL